MKRNFKNVFLLIIIAAIGACVTVEETNRTRLAPLPDSYMNSLGASAYDDMLKTEKVSNDKAMTAKVLEVGKRLANVSGKSYDWAFTLFDSKEVNAFCLPGGRVGVYTGIVPIAKTNAALAAVLGHEIGHAIARHSGERMSESLLVTGVLISVEEVMGDSNRKQIVMGALGLGAQFGVLLPFSRVHESEADQIGLTLMARAGYDPHEAITLWKRMAALGGNPPQFLSTHPDPERRAEALQSQLPAALALYEKSAKVPTTNL